MKVATVANKANSAVTEGDAKARGVLSYLLALLSVSCWPLLKDPSGLSPRLGVCGLDV